MGQSSIRVLGPKITLDVKFLFLKMYHLKIEVIL